MKKNLYKKVFGLITGLFTMLLTGNIAFADLVPAPAPISRTSTILILAGVVVVLAVVAVIIIAVISKKNAK